MPPFSQSRDAKSQRQMDGALRGASWDDLRIFLVCASEGSFRKASATLKIDSATVVRRIGRLEEILGHRLFNRLTDGATLTEEGQAIVDEVRAMERAANNIERHSKLTDVGIRGRVRVAVTEGLGVYWVLPRLLEFQKANRRLTFELQTTMDVTDVGRLEADISVQFVRPERPDLVAVRLGFLHTYPFVSVGYEKLFGLPRGVDDLKNHRVIQQLSPLLGEGVYERVLGVDSLEGIVGIGTNSSSAVLYAIERDAGVGFLPTYALALGANLVPLDIGSRNRLEIWMTYHPDIRHSSRHMAVVEWLRRIFDATRFLCFAEEFVHPRDLISAMADSAAINQGGGFATANPSLAAETAKKARAPRGAAKSGRKAG
jgi:DNA-binding transcriptional LysR family regulator